MEIVWVKVMAVRSTPQLSPQPTMQSRVWCSGEWCGSERGGALDGHFGDPHIILYIQLNVYSKHQER